MTYTETEARRLRGEARHIAAIRRALLLQLEPVFAAVERGAHPEVAAGYVKALPLAAPFADIYTTVGARFALATFAELGGGKAAALTKAPDWLSNVVEFLRLESSRRITAVTETTKQFVRNVLGSAVDAGLSIPNTAKLLRQDAMQMSGLRARTIARTEIVSASNLGSLYGASQANIPGLLKEWIATPGPRTRIDHARANGQRVPMEGRFAVGGEAMLYPGDGNASAANVINCRCSIGYYVPGR